MHQFPAIVGRFQRLADQEDRSTSWKPAGNNPSTQKELLIAVSVFAVNTTTQPQFQFHLTSLHKEYQMNCSIYLSAVYTLLAFYTKPQINSLAEEAVHKPEIKNRTR